MNIVLITRQNFDATSLQMGRDQSPRLRRSRTVVRIRRHARSLRLVEHLGQEIQGCGDRLYRPERQRCEYQRGP
jgi:hypothetical protein